MNFVKIGITTSLPVSYLLYTRIKNREKSYTYEEIASHKNSSTKIWTTYKNNVYDITDFVNIHPGGKDKIMLSAGESLEPYWNHYKQHQKKEVFDLLEPMKIGTIADYNPDKFKNLNDPYLSDPVRNSELRFHSIRPCNAETPVHEIQNNPITPNENWYIRNHNPVPSIDSHEYKLELFDKDNLLTSLSLDELKQMPSREVVTTIQCGGNRRGEFENTSGTQWDIGAISTAKWEGVPLCSLLENRDGNYIHAEGYDGVKSSISFEKGSTSNQDVLLAYKMNGETLPPDHGYPVRMIVPGYVGIKNIKWLKKITISNEEVDGPWQKGMAYKILPKYLQKLEDVKTVDLDTIPTIEELPLQSCITNIEKVEDKEDMYRISGYAYSSKPNVTLKVSVSVDDGKSWQDVETDQDSKFKWGWVLWSTEIVADYNSSVLCKAVDDNGNSQPVNVSDVWNVRGLANNSIHKKAIRDVIF